MPFWNYFTSKRRVPFILSSLISDSYVLQRGSISYQTEPPTPPIPRLEPHHPLQPYTHPDSGRVLCTVLVTIPWAGPPSLIEFHSRDNKEIYIRVVDWLVWGTVTEKKVLVVSVGWQQELTSAVHSHVHLQLEIVPRLTCTITSDGSRISQRGDLLKLHRIEEHWTWGGVFIFIFTYMQPWIKLTLKLTVMFTLLLKSGYSYPD